MMAREWIHEPGTGLWTASGGAADAETFDLLVSGDLCPRGRTEPLILAGKSAEVLADILPELGRKHLSVVNLEAPLTNVGTPILKSGPNLRVHPGCIEAVKAGQWDVACCANNHMGDFGPEPVTETLGQLRRHGIFSVGAGENLEEARRPLFVERGGVRIALLAFAENEFGIAASGKAGANPLQPLRNLAQIREAATCADFTVVLVHGGNEYNPVPSPRAVETYRAFAEAGASAVVAGHTHCPQGFEIWNGVPIVYSLGNFLFDQPFTNTYSGYNWWYGYMVRIGFTGGRAARIEVIPHYDAPGAEAVRLLRGEERRTFFSYVEYLSAILADEAEVRRYYEAFCLQGINGYFARLGVPFYPVDWDDPESARRFMDMRNLHTCEAHCELVTATLRLLEERREEEARQYIPRLQALSEGRIPE